MINETLLVCDMDGTLLNSDSKISNENYYAILDFVNKGGLFTVATGRMYPAVIPYLDQLPMNIPAIVYNGAMIYDFKNKNILWQKTLPLESKSFIKIILETFPELAAEIYHNDDLYFIGENNETDEHRNRESFKPNFINIDKIPTPWLKVILAWNPGKLKEVEKWLDSQKLPFRFTYSEPQFIELLNHEVSKGKALDELIKITGIKRENIVAMGDNLNDIELLQSAGIGIAVENAHDELKKIADSQSTHHNDHAVKNVIEWIFKRNNN
jgi:Cof subfamily protein (haloacid dehalogenase superfamily)